MRSKMVEEDWVDAVIGLGPNLFYNSPMESCIVVCRRGKDAKRKGRVIFIDAAAEVARERSQSFLKQEHQDRILSVYRDYRDETGFAKVASVEEIVTHQANLSIPLYVRGETNKSTPDERRRSFQTTWSDWRKDGEAFWRQMDELVATLNALHQEEVALPQVDD